MLIPAILLISAAAGGDSLKSPPPRVYNGRQGQTTVHIPRLDDLEIIDGTLNDPVWQQAAVLTGFSEYTPIDGLPAEDSTEVLVWYSHKAIYFGIRAFEPHGVAHYKLADRDRIDADDNVQIILSPFLHARQAMVFAGQPGRWASRKRRHDHGGCADGHAVQHGHHADWPADHRSES